MGITKYQVTSLFVLVRKNKNLLGKILGTLQKGDIIEVIEINSNWASIKYNNTIGYVLAYSLTLYRPQIKGSVTIQYMDMDSNISLIETETYSNLSLGTYVYDAKIISGYSLTSESTVSVTLTEERPHQTITFTYEKILGSITIQYLDHSSQSPLMETVIKADLALGSYTYKAPSISGYSLSSDSSVSVTLTEEQPHQTITFTYQQILGSITIQYLDYSSQNPLMDPVTQTNLTLGTYSYDATSISGYSLTSNSSISVTLTEEQPHQTITFTYQQILGSITIQYLDYSSQNPLMDPVTQTNLTLGTYSYDATSISGYSLTSNSSISVTLTEERPHQSITFTYEQILGSITIQYLNESSHSPLMNAVTKTNLNLGSYTYEAPSISGYSLTSEASVSVTLTEGQPHQTITFTYQQILGSITIQYLDHSSQNSLVEVVIETDLALGSYTYEAPSISGYSLSSDSSVSVTLTEDQPHQTITFTYEQIFGSITIQYLDHASQNSLMEAVIETDLALRSYTYEAPSISGYSLTSDSTVSVTLTEEQPHQTVTFTYEQILGSITIQYLDYSSQAPLMETVVKNNLALGSYTYEATSISGYSLTSESSVSVTLTEEQPHQTITFTYEQILSSITIQYLDHSSQSPLMDYVTENNLALGSYTYEATSISGYSLTSKATVSVTLTEEQPHQTITFTYQQILGSITIQYLDDSSGTELVESINHSNLSLGTYTYEAKSIEGYQLITTNSITVTLTDSNPDQIIQFTYRKEEQTQSIDESLQNEVPYISTYYIKPIVAPGEEVVIDYYITDYYHKEYTNDDYSDTFTVTVHIEDYPDIIIKDLKAGDHSVSLGSFTIEREQKFSIICEDQYGRHSHELFNFFLVRTEPEINEYIMTEEDLILYNIKNTDDYEELLEVPLTLETVNATTVKEALLTYAQSYTPKPNTYTCFLPKTSETDDPARWWNSIVTKYADDYDKEAVATQSQNTRLGLQALLDDKAAKGYNKLKLLPGTYRIDHTGTLYIPTQFTLDMNGATLKLNPFTGSGALMLTLNNTFDSHVINGTIEGDFYSHDYANSTNNSEWINGVSIGGEAKYSSFENLTIRDITGYGSTNGIANSRDGSIGYTYLYPQAMGDTFKLGDIDTKTGLEIASTNRTTSNFKNISGYSEIGYLSISIYLGYQGNPCGTWNLLCHFYDESKNYIQSIHSYQYRRIRVPQNAKYLRITILNESYPTNLSIQLFRIPTHCSFKKLKYDNCRCVGSAPAAMKDMLIQECEFTRCGHSGAFCALDAEDGWDMMQDVTYKELNFYNNVRNDFLTCAGHNFIVENQLAGSQYIWGRTRNLIARDCNLNTATYHDGDLVYHGIYQIYNNYYENLTSTNNNLVKYCSGKQINGYASYSNLTFIGNGTYLGCNFTYSNENPPYLSTCNLKNCIVTSNQSDIECNLRFNSADGPFYFENIIFKNKTYLNSNNNFSNATFNGCAFEDMRMRVLVSQNNNLIKFNDCQIKCQSSSEFIYISPFVYSKGITNINFLNCILEMITDNPNFKLIYGYAKATDSNYQFNNCKINQKNGTILDIYSSYSENFSNFHIIFNYCDKLSVPYSTANGENLINSTIYITENNPV